VSTDLCLPTFQNDVVLQTSEKSDPSRIHHSPVYSA